MSIITVTDTHFGRVFRNGVPLDKRGVYEKMIMEKFESALESVKSGDIFIHMGDLFDSPQVSNEILMNVYFKIFWNRRDDAQYYFIAGNHDLYREDGGEMMTSFYILHMLLSSYVNVHFLFAPTRDITGENYLVPWSYFTDYENLVIPDGVKRIYGHFNDPVPMPVASFHGEKYSGHYHKQHIAADGTVFIGSVLPMAFGEETGTDVMETVTLEEYNERGADSFEGKRVRIILKDGEELPPISEFKGIQLVSKNESGVDDEINMEVKFDEDFDFKTKFFEYLSDCKIKNELWELYETLKAME